MDQDQLNVKGDSGRNRNVEQIDSKQKKCNDISQTSRRGLDGFPEKFSQIFKDR